MYIAMKKLFFVSVAALLLNSCGPEHEGRRFAKKYCNCLKESYALFEELKSLNYKISDSNIVKYCETKIIFDDDNLYRTTIAVVNDSSYSNEQRDYASTFFYGFHMYLIEECNTDPHITW